MKKPEDNPTLSSNLGSVFDYDDDDGVEHNKPKKPAKNDPKPKLFLNCTLSYGIGRIKSQKHRIITKTMIHHQV